MADKDIWDDPDLQQNDDYVKFEKVGDSLKAVILKIGKKEWPDGKTDPQLLVRTKDGERTLTAGQARLKAQLVELRPQVGDGLSITLTKIEPRGGGKTLKHFDVQVIKPGQQAQAASTPPPAPEPVAAAPASDDGIPF